MRTRYFLVVLSLLVSLSPVWAADSTVSTTLTLPAPKLDGAVSVEKALKERRSVRNPSAAPLTLEDIGQLCWAAQGVTDDKGHRTASSAMALYPLELYVVVGAVTGLAPGFYHYEPGGHGLRLVAAGDKRTVLDEKAIGQSWVAKVPAIFVISGVAERMARIKERGRQFMDIEAGLAAQGFFLEATAMGLGSTYVGGFTPLEARTVLSLPATEEILAILPVGHKP